jgi:hypothetical protein
MKSCRFVFVIALLFATFAQTFAQTSTTNATESKEEKDKARAELEKKAVALVDRTADDASLLKLPENRAFVDAHAADLIWKLDEKRARRLFRNAAEQLILAQAEFEKAEGEMPFMSMQMAQPRQQILQTVAKRDADLALELLLLTRPARLTAEIQKAAAAEAVAASQQPAPAQNESPAMSGWESKYLVQGELRLEQSFATRAAENNPQRAVKMIRESLAKNGVTGEVWNMLQKLHQKDEDAAKSLLGDVVAKLVESDLSRKENERQAAVQFLMRFTAAKPAEKSAEKKDAGTTDKKPPLKPDDAALRDVAGKVVDAFLQAKNFTSLFEINGLLPILEKLVPGRIAAIRQKQAALKKMLPAEQVQDMEMFSGLSNPNATPEEQIKSAAKVPPGMRRFVYQSAVTKMVQNGEAERARQLLNEAPAGTERDKALELIDSQVAQKAVKDGKFDDARKIIGKITNKNAQIEQLASMARAFHAKNTKEDKETAAKLMDEARRLIDDTPQSEEEINALLAVVAGYAVVEPTRAFALLEPLIDQANELMQAAALLSKYNKRDFRYRNGEMSYILGGGGMQGSVGRFRKELGLLAAADFERTRNLTDKFSRQDGQVLARLTLAQSILQEKNEVEVAGIGGGIVAFDFDF